MLGMTLPAAVLAAGTALALSGAALSGAVSIAAGASSAVWWYFYFKNLGYADNGAELVIYSGIFIKKAKRLRKSDILWTNSVTLFKAPVLTVLHTGGGSVTVLGKMTVDS